MGSDGNSPSVYYLAASPPTEEKNFLRDPKVLENFFISGGGDLCLFAFSGRLGSLLARLGHELLFFKC